MSLTERMEKIIRMSIEARNDAEKFEGGMHTSPRTRLRRTLKQIMSESAIVLHLSEDKK